MTTAALEAAPRPVGRRTRPLPTALGAAVAELRRREPLLAAFGFACLVGVVVTAALAATDPRLIGGASVWLKPMKFFGSIAVYALTWAWYARLVHPDRRGAPLLRRAACTLVVSASFELVYITFQAAHAQASHFNIGDPLHAMFYALMGLGAVALTGSNLPLAWAIARHPAAEDADTGPALRRAVLLGLVLTVVLGGGLGGYVSAHGSHAVGVETRHLTLLGWNRTGGDLRIAHFLGMHAEQVLPLVVLAAARLGARAQRVAPWFAAVVWTALTLAVFSQAVAGHAFPRG